VETQNFGPRSLRAPSKRAAILVPPKGASFFVESSHIPEWPVSFAPFPRLTICFVPILLARSKVAVVLLAIGTLLRETIHSSGAVAPLVSGLVESFFVIAKGVTDHAIETMFATRSREP